MKERHRQIQEFIRSYYLQNGYGPTTREIADGIGVKSTSTVQANIVQMERLGLIARGDHSQPRSIRVPGLEAPPVYVLHGHWSMPGDDGVNVWGVSPDLESLQRRMYETGERMAEDAIDAEVEFSDVKTSGTAWEAQDGDGNYIRLYITEHEVEKGTGGRDHAV